jgi:hypothetical protein
MTRKREVPEIRLSVTEFKAKCLAVFDQLEQRKIKRVVVTRRGKPVVEIGLVKAKVPSLWGCNRGKIWIDPKVDLTQPVSDEPWDAELGILHR